jgi:hypothetical protein
MPKKVKETKEVIRVSTDTRNLKCLLTDDELKVSSEEVARLVQEKNCLEADKKSYASSFKAKIDSTNAAILEQTNKIRNKYEYRNIPCRIELNFTTCRIKVIRMDTHEVIEDRLMTYSEKDSRTVFDAPKATEESEGVDDSDNNNQS